MEPQNNLLSERNKKIWRKNQIPVSPYFELTPRCTLDCKMCYVHLTREQMGDRRELTAEQWNQIADEAVKAGIRRRERNLCLCCSSMGDLCFS